MVSESAYQQCYVADGPTGEKLLAVKPNSRLAQVINERLAIRKKYHDMAMIYAKSEGYSHYIDQLAAKVTWHVDGYSGSFAVGTDDKDIKTLQVAFRTYQETYPNDYDYDETLQWHLITSDSLLGQLIAAAQKQTKLFHRDNTVAQANQKAKALSYGNYREQLLAAYWYRNGYIQSWALTHEEAEEASLDLAIAALKVEHLDWWNWNGRDTDAITLDPTCELSIKIQERIENALHARSPDLVEEKRLC